MTAHPSLSASIEQLENSFEAARGDYAQLKLIADALQHHSASGAPRLRIKVVARQGLPLRLDLRRPHLSSRCWAGSVSTRLTAGRCIGTDWVQRVTIN
jgi:hypothetical protein